MQGQVLTTLESWAAALLLYPGLLFVAVLALVGEWLIGGVLPVLVPRISRVVVSRYTFMQPLYDLAKLLGRQPSGRWLPSASRPSVPATGLAALAAIAPVMALLLMPLPGSPAAGDAWPFDVVVVLALLAVQPVVSAALKLGRGGLETLRGGQDLGRLITGLLPALLVIAALAEVSNARGLQLASLTAAPETAAQALVRLLSAGVLLVALPWWSVGGNAEESAGLYAGHMAQRVALAVLWAVLVLPVPGELPWAVLVLLVGALVAYVAMWLAPERRAGGRSQAGYAGLVWSAAVPAAVLALVVALWWPGV